MGDCAVAGDLRWSGAYGVDVDFVARSHCSVAIIPIEDILVRIPSFSIDKLFLNHAGLPLNPCMLPFRPHQSTFWCVLGFDRS
jgi:hypothetical protein